MSQATSPSAFAPDEPPYQDFLGELQTHFDRNIYVDASARLYTTDHPSHGQNTLFDLFLSHIPATHVQFYTCQCCRRFVNTFGGLVTIDSEGVSTSAVWKDTAAPFFADAVHALRTHVETARVNGVFLSANKVWGTPVTGPWTHMAIKPDKSLLYTGRIKTAEQMMAEKREDFRTMIEALRQLSLANVNTAVGILQTDALYRNEKVLGVATWLQSLHMARDRAAHRNRENILWRAVALAPPGFCHPRSSMIGTLLEDIEAGYPFEVIERRFKAKMHPLQYQRPQAAPAEQNIKRAEEIVAKLGIAPSLKRRYARLDEVIAIWTPKEAAKPAGKRSGVFENVAAKNAAPVPDNMTLPVTTITVEKFKRTVLPTANSIEFWVPRINAHYTALVTAEEADAPPILQWDMEDRRNPVSSYVYHGGSSAVSWGLSAGTLVPVLAVSLFPSNWIEDNHLSHMGDGLVMILAGARDSAHRTAGGALFPEILKASLHEVRATIEAYSKKATIAGYENSSACGLSLSKNAKAGHRFRVKTNTTTTDYELDRWD